MFRRRQRRGNEKWPAEPQGNGLVLIEKSRDKALVHVVLVTTSYLFFFPAECTTDVIFTVRSLSQARKYKGESSKSIGIGSITVQAHSEFAVLTVIVQ